MTYISNRLFLAGISLLLGACSTLPASGPTGGELRSSALDDGNIALVEVDSPAALPADVQSRWQLPALDPLPATMIGIGDVLALHIFEAGVPLFSAQSGSMGSAISSASGSIDPAVKQQSLPPLQVDENGDITVPFVGAVHVLGKTVFEAQRAVAQALSGLSENPQVLITRQSVIGNSVIVGGEVNNPGRLVLRTNRESMADVIALAGGYRGAPKDLMLRVVRGGEAGEMRLGRVLGTADDDLPAYPGDRITLLNDPMMYSVLGASGRVQQMPFSRETMNLVEAISAAGGAHNSFGDPEAIFVLRFTGSSRTEPVVYHFNMMHARSFFLAEGFTLRDNDVLYFGNAQANRPSKLIQLISQLFAPIVTVANTANMINGN